MKIKRPILKRYITILLDEKELAKREAVKAAYKGNGILSDRKIFMAMVDALGPTETSGADLPEVVVSEEE